MNNVRTLLPKLTLNELFVRDFMAADAPCFSIGYVEERGSISGFLALRPQLPIPQSSTQQGFRFGHSVVGTEGNPVLHFAIEFYGHAVYNGLVNPGNPMVRSVLATMLETEDYYFFAINADQTMTAFRSQLEHPDLAGLRTNQMNFEGARCSEERYEQVCRLFEQKPDPPGQLLEWVYRDNPDYLDLTEYRLELNPRQG